jgi:hypothetical protein
MGMSLWMPSLVAVKVESRLMRLVTPPEMVPTRAPSRLHG